jgi:hypothetical protein
MVHYLFNDLPRRLLLAALNNRNRHTGEGRYSGSPTYGFRLSPE